MNELAPRRAADLGPVSPRGEWAYQPPDQMLHVRDLLRLLGRRKWVILGAASLVVVPVAVWSMLAPKMYRAEAVIQIDPEPAQVLPYRELGSTVNAGQFEMFLKGQSELLQGPTLRERVAARLSVSNDARLRRETSALGSRFAAQGVENTYLFKLAYTSEESDTAASVANLFAEEYMKQHFETRQETRQRARALLERELQALAGRVQDSEKGLVSYAQSNRLSIDEKETNPARLRLSDASLRLTQAEADVAVARSKRQALEGASAEALPEALTTNAISGLSSRLLQLESDLSTLEATFGANWPTVVAKRQDIVLAREQLEREKRLTLARAREQARLDLETMSVRRDLVADQLISQQKLVNALDNATVEFNIIKRDVDTSQKLYDGMLERLSQTSITSGMEFGGIQVVERALVPGVPDSPKVAWNITLASILGLALGFCFVVGREYMDTSVSTIDDLANEVGLPVLGAVPLVERHTPRRLFRRRQRLSLAAGQEGRDAAVGRQFLPDSAAADAIRNVCTSIILSRSDRPPRVLMVTSSRTGEGKTTVARELGYGFAERGAQTVLVECDLRKPTFTRLFGVPEDGGLTPWLAGVSNVPPTVHELPDGLAVVTAGPRAPNAVVLLDSARLREFVTHLLDHYRFVILDAPPGLGVADARVLATVVEGAVLVARAGRSQGALVRTLRGAMESAGIGVLGTVLNGTGPDVVTDFLSKDYYS
jgi:capsular exopolysaccharide synthesis family protein